MPKPTYVYMLRAYADEALRLIRDLEAEGPNMPGRKVGDPESPIAILSEAIEGARRCYLRLIDLDAVLTEATE